MSVRAVRCARLLIAIAVFGLPAISIADDDPVPESTFVFRFAAPVDSVWKAAVEYTIDLGCPLVLNDKENLKLRTAHLRALRRDIGYGGWVDPLSDFSAIVTVQMISHGDSVTDVNLTATLSAILGKGNNLLSVSSNDSNWKSYKTTGHLEHRIFTEIGKHLGIDVPPLPNKFLKPRVDSKQTLE